MAINTYKQYLMKKGTGQTASYTKLVDIKSTPDIGGTPEMLETTTKSDPIQTFIPGIITLSSDGLEFTANYTLTDYQTLKALENTEGEYAIWFGASTSGSTVTPDGSQGKWKFSGILSVFPTGSGVNEVQEMTISIAPSTPIEFEAP